MKQCYEKLACLKHANHEPYDCIQAIRQLFSMPHLIHISDVADTLSSILQHPDSLGCFMEKESDFKEKEKSGVFDDLVLCDDMYCNAPKSLGRPYAAEESNSCCITSFNFALQYCIHPFSDPEKLMAQICKNQSLKWNLLSSNS